MGDGRRLKEILDERNMSVRSVAKQAGISPTTLYTIVQNSGEEVLPKLPSGLDDMMDGNRIKRYLHNFLYPLMNYFGKDNLPMVDQHLTNYYMLNDEGRKDVDQFIESLLKIKKNPERAKDVKNIKW